MNAKNTKHHEMETRPNVIPNGTLVVSTEDGEPGTVVKICTLKRSGTKAWSYVVKTQYGREVWDASTLFIPEAA